MGRRPAGRPPPAVPQAGARLRGDHAEGPDAGHARRRRLRAADRAHQRRPGRGRGLRGAGARARADRPRAAGPARPASRSTSSSSTCPSTPPTPVRAALAEAGAGRIGDYDHASFSTPGEGRFRPLEGANPTIGTVGAGRGRRRGADRGGAAAVAARPASSRRCWRPTPTRSRRTTSSSWPTRAPSATGTGRIGDVAGDDAGASSRRRSPRRCRRPPHGVRVAGDPDRPVRRVAVCGGAGDFLLDRVARHRRRRLRDQRPAAPPGGRVPRAGRPGAGRRRALGGRVDLAAGGARRGWREALGDTVETRVSTHRAPTPGQFRI